MGNSNHNKKAEYTEQTAHTRVVGLLINSKNPLWLLRDGVIALYPIDKEDFLYG